MVLRQSAFPQFLKNCSNLELFFPDFLWFCATLPPYSTFYFSLLSFWRTGNGRFCLFCISSVNEHWESLKQFHFVSPFATTPSLALSGAACLNRFLNLIFWNPSTCSCAFLNLFQTLYLESAAACVFILLCRSVLQSHHFLCFLLVSNVHIMHNSAGKRCIFPL